MKNNSFCHNTNINSSISKDFNKKNSKNAIGLNYSKKAKPRLNHSVDYSRIKDQNDPILFGNNNYNFNCNKKQNLNKSLSIENINHKYTNNTHKKYNNKSKKK